MHKNQHQNAGNGIKETLFFKIFPGSMASDPPRGSRLFFTDNENDNISTAELNRQVGYLVKNAL